MHDTVAQEFWLSSLGSASRFNEWVFAQFKDNLGRKVLEIGCGIGNFTVMIAGLGCEVTAVDIHEPFVDTARARLFTVPNVNVICADVTSSAWRREFDSVVLLDVLEHIEDDVGLLQNLSAALRPGGRLIVKVPAGPWLLNEMDRAIGHYRRYSRRSLAAAMTQANLVVEEQRYFNRLAIAGWWFNGTFRRRVTPPGEHVAGFERLVPLLRVIEEKVPFPFGLPLPTYRLDNVLSDVAALMAIGVALFPTTSDAGNASAGAKTIAVVHLMCACVLFILLAVFSLFLFTKTDQPKIVAAKQRRNRVYRTCGAIIVGALVLVVVTEAAKPPRSWNSLFWLESVAVVAFGVSWLVKGGFLGLLADPK